MSALAVGPCADCGCTGGKPIVTPAGVFCVRCRETDTVAHGHIPACPLCSGSGLVVTQASARLTWTKLDGRKTATYRAETPTGDYYVTAQHDESGRRVGFSVAFNHYAPNAKGYHWTLLRAGNTLSRAKASASDHAQS